MSNGPQLYCMTGKECCLYKATVSPHYNGLKLYQSNSMFDQCYTLLVYPNDLAPFIVSSYGTGIVYVNALGNQDWKLAYDGYYCSKRRPCYLPNSAGFHHWEADLGQTRIVTAVKIQMQDAWIPVCFDSVNVRLGVKPDYVPNPMFPEYIGQPAKGSLVTFTPSAPMAGRYIRLTQTNESTCWGICEIFILG